MLPLLQFNLFILAFCWHVLHLSASLEANTVNHKQLKGRWGHSHVSVLGKWSWVKRTGEGLWLWVLCCDVWLCHCLAVLKPPSNGKWQAGRNVLDLASLSTVLYLAIQCPEISICFCVKKHTYRALALLLTCQERKELEKLQNRRKKRKRLLILENVYFNACTCKAIQSMKLF